MRLRTALALLGLLSITNGGCAELQSVLGAVGDPARAGLPPPPRVEVAAVRLAQAPTPEQLAVYACTKVAPPFICSMLAVGMGVSTATPTVAFELELAIANQARVPVPLVEILVGFTAWPEARGQRNLGATCVTLCEDPRAGCATPAGACQAGANERDIRSLSDFGVAAANFLVRVATGEARIETLRVRTVQPSETLRATFRFELDVDQVVELMRAVGDEAINELQRGRVPQFAIPYRLEGTLWVRIEGLGRVGVTLPATTGTFRL